METPTTDQSPKRSRPGSACNGGFYGPDWRWKPIAGGGDGWVYLVHPTEPGVRGARRYEYGFVTYDSTAR
jgi:hypothetical protein